MDVARQLIHEVRAVREAFPFQKLERLVGEIPRRRAESNRSSRQTRERFDRAYERALLAGGIVGVRADVLVAVMADLVAGAMDRAHGVGVVVGVETGNEEGRWQPLALEQVEDCRNANVRRV